MASSSRKHSLQHGNANPATRSPLPHNLADLLALAVRDARRLDAASYIPHSGNWHFPTQKGICEVCLAGSVIAVSLRISRQVHAVPKTFTPIVQRQLHAIDYMRCGLWTHAFLILYDRSAVPSIAQRLRSLPMPADASFRSWPEFNAHLDSLESIIPELREIEEADRSL